MSKKKVPDAVKKMLATAEAQSGIETRTPFSDFDNFDGNTDPTAIMEDCAAEPETDIGNGRRFLHRYGHRVLHVARIGWHGYDGKRWKEDEDGSVVRPLAQRTAELIDDEARLLTATDEDQKLINDGQKARADRKKMGNPKKTWGDELFNRYLALEEAIEAGEEAKKRADGRKSSRHRHAKSSAGTSKINNMMTEAQPHVAKIVTDMNADLYSFNCDNGTLHFLRTEDEESEPDDPRYRWEVKSEQHKPAEFISKLAPTAFTPDTPAPTWEKFLATVQPDIEIRAFLQRFMGYCITGLTVEQCLLFFYGAGRNGKSTFLDAIGSVIGDYAVTLSIDSFAGESRRGGSEATPDLARLPGARLVAASEPEMGVRLKDALIKSLTGGEVIPVRRLHEDFFEVHPQFKIILSGNHRPRIDDTSDGIWRRVYLVPWEIQIPKEQIDRALPVKLKQEAAGILAWMVNGCIDYLNYGLNPPEKVITATKEYREDSDPIGAFIRTACIVTGKEDDQATPGDLYVGYTNWAAKEGAAEFRAATFSRRFPDYQRLSWQSPDGVMRQFWKAKAGTTVYKGISIKDRYLNPKAEDYPAS